MSSLNTLDIIFCIVTILIVIVATYRGVVKEFFSLINWIIAFALSYLLSPLLSKIFINYFDNKLILYISIRMAVFLVSFISFILLTSRFVEDLNFSFNYYLNKFLGAVFGIFKSILIFGLVYSLYNCFFDYALGQKLISKNSNKMPTWYTDSYSSSVINIAGNTLDPVVQVFISFLKVNYSDVLHLDKTIENKIESRFKFNPDGDQEIQNNPEPKSNMQPQPEINPSNILDSNTANQKKDIGKSDSKKNDSGYDKIDIQKMQNLIEIINQ